jgi:hypothetical protein
VAHQGEEGEKCQQHGAAHQPNREKQLSHSSSIQMQKHHYAASAQKQVSRLFQRLSENCHHVSKLG